MTSLLTKADKQNTTVKESYLGYDTESVWRVNSTFSIKQYGYHSRMLKFSTKHDGKQK